MSSSRRLFHPPSAFISKRLLSAAIGAIGLVCLQASGASAATPTFSSIFSFGGENGSNPNGKLLFDAAGNLYGTTYNGGTYGRGTVFELSPGANGYTETVLYTFTGHADGSHPTAGLVMDANGSLYGTASATDGKPAGTVFELKLSAGSYNFGVIHSFGTAGDGAYPNCDLVFGSKGALYGTTVSGGSSGNGTVFELTPPAAKGDTWTETVIYSFTGAADGSNPYAGVVFDTSGNLYGTASAGGTAKAGTVFMLTPPAQQGSVWTETTIYEFMGTTDGANPFAEVLIGSKGAIFGSTFIGGSGFGVVFELTPPVTPGNPYTQTVLLSFDGKDGANPSDALIVDASGSLYGTSGGAVAGSNGNVFKLVNAKGTFTEDVLYTFTGGSDGMTPLASLVADKAGALYSTTFYGGAGGSGSIFQIK